MRRRLLFAVAASAVLAALALSRAPIGTLPSSLRSARADTLKPRTLKRVEDWVIVTGKDLGAIKGKHKDLVRLYASRAGQFLPIAYQIDERLPDGNFCFTDGSPEFLVKDTDRGLIDDNDELCFMAKDAGDEASPNGLPAGHDVVQGIEVTDPATGETAWVYAVTFDAPPPRSTKRYSWLEKGAENSISWFGERFSSDNARSTWNACRLTSLRFAKPEDEVPDYSKSGSVIDCSKVTLRLKKWFKSLQWDSTDFYVKIGGYCNGPVRTIVQSLMEFDVAFGFKIRAKDSYIVMYATASTMPTNCDNPVDISDSPGESWYKLLMDLDSKNCKGWKFYNNWNKTPVDIDGKMSDAENKLDKKWPDYNCVFGPEGAIISRFVLPKEVVRDTNELYYSDDLNAIEPPEFQPGNFGTFGYKLDLSGVKAGLYTGDYVIFYVAAPFAQGDERKFLDIVDKPLVAKAR